jgi:hypothetical protein
LVSVSLPAAAAATAAATTAAAVTTTAAAVTTAPTAAAAGTTVAAAATAAVSTTAATAASVAAATTAAAATAGALARLADVDGPTLDVTAIEGFRRLARLGVGRHLDERKSARASRVAVEDDLHVCDAARFAEDLAQVSLGDAIR